jgi:hypothetical protein
VEDPPYALRTQVNGTPGNVHLSWTAPVGARYFEAQSTTDLRGETGWVTAGKMPTKTKIEFTGLTSGTRFAFRVRAWGNGLPGPWSYASAADGIVKLSAASFEGRRVAIAARLSYCCKVGCLPPAV